MKVDYVDLTLSIVPPHKCTKEEVEEWIDFQLTGGSMSVKNPLVDCDLKDMLRFSHDSPLVEYSVKVKES